MLGDVYLMHGDVHLMTITWS